MNKQIKTIEEYSELAHMADVAEECLGTLRFGSHWALMKKLSEQYGVVVRDSRLAIKAARRLCDEFMMAWKAGQE